MSQSIAQIRLFANEAVAINISSLRIEQSDLRVLICKLTCTRRLGCFLLLCRAAFRFQASPVRLKLCNRQVKSVTSRSPICSVYSRCCLLTGVSCGCGRGPVVRHLFFSHRKTRQDESSYCRCWCCIAFFVLTLYLPSPSQRVNNIIFAQK